MVLVLGAEPLDGLFLRLNEVVSCAEELRNVRNLLVFGDEGYEERQGNCRRVRVEGKRMLKGYLRWRAFWMLWMVLDDEIQFFALTPYISQHSASVNAIQPEKEIAA